MGGKEFYSELQQETDKRYTLDWSFGTQGKPGINGDIQNAAEAVRMIADRHFEVQGTNATSGSTAMFAEGGVVLATAGAGADQVIIMPHADPNQTAWTQVTWGTDREVEWDFWFATGPNITGTTIWAGLKLTNTPVSATDADQVFFRYQDTVAAGNFQFVSSIATVLTATDTGVAVAIDANYHLRIKIYDNRIAQGWINDVLVGTTGQLTDAIDLIPLFGVQADAAAAKSIRIFRQRISRVTMAS